MTTTNRPTVWMLVGLPGSGKTHWTKEFLKTNPDVELLSSDKWIEKYAKDNDKTYSEVFKEAFPKAQKAYEETFTEILKHRKSCVIDRTNCSAGSRKRTLSRFPKEYDKKCVLILSDRFFLERVNEARKMIGRDIPQSVMFTMENTFDLPELSEGFSEIIRVYRKKEG